MKHLLTLSVFFLFSFSLFSQDHDPVANPEAVIVGGNARFTVLQDDLVRMEWSEDGRFTDQASLTIVNRKLPVPVFTQKTENGVLTISTRRITLSYTLNSGPFSSANLKARLAIRGEIVEWRPGTVDKANLLGTARTLDTFDGAPDSLEQGLVSRSGWTLLDDSERPLFDNSDWAWVQPRETKKQQDFYLFVYGDNYKGLLKDYTSIAGKIALPPRFAFGAWWSRYREYTDLQFRELVDEFKAHDLPLDVLVIDIDWHLRSLPGFFKDGILQRDQAGEGFGWTGYTWDKDHFPNPAKFLEWTNKEQLKTCLNLHPASGVQPFEEQYPEFARAMGVDPATKKYIPFDITNKHFAQNYLDLLLHPMEKMGVDFWWLDWQQWGNTTIPGVNPTFYLNYVHYSDMERQDKVRPLIFHRWGGLGNHRYQIGFSGDTRTTWKSLAYQPYFTSTAANVGFGYWSHDIGGHFGPKEDPELYTRWIQWGIFSPIFRTHAAMDYYQERRPWMYPQENYTAMRAAYLLRYALVPYIYNEAYNTYETGLSLLHPMYYEHPKEEKAYGFPNQYYFGRDMIVSPVVKPIGKDSVYTLQEVWLPRGTWYDWSTHTALEGGKVIQYMATLHDIPVFVKAGAIIPMQPKVDRLDDPNINPLIFTVFPGDSGSTVLYEDEGNSNGFKNGEYVETPVSFSKNGQVVHFTIGSMKGSYPGMSTNRGYELRFTNTFSPQKVEVNGLNYAYSEQANPGCWSYVGAELETRIYVSAVNTREKVVVKITFPAYDQQLLSGLKGKMRYIEAFENVRVSGVWARGKYDSQVISRLSQFGQRLQYEPTGLANGLKSFNKDWNDALHSLQQACSAYPAHLPWYRFLKKFGNVAELPVIKDAPIKPDHTTKLEFNVEPGTKVHYSVIGVDGEQAERIYTKPVELKVPVEVSAYAASATGGANSAGIHKTIYAANSGLRYKLYKGYWDKIPDLKTLAVDTVGIAQSLDPDVFSPLKMGYVVNMEGMITIPKDDIYTFELGSDDGSMLYINSETIVDNDGLHGFLVKSGQKRLKAGKYPIRIIYHQGSGDQQLELLVSSPGMSKRQAELMVELKPE
ncbi:MAG: TIM-barrel domain-containing protein [Bacteroidota bacterium]